MAKDPAVLFYTADFLVGTYGFTMQERGEYITLLCLQHQQGHLSEDTVRSIASSAAVIDKFLRDPHGRYYNERLDIEKIKRENYSRSRSENGSKGGRPRKNQGTDQKPYGFHMDNTSKAYEKHTENENEIDFNTLVIDNTKDKSLDQGIKDSTFSFSKEKEEDPLSTTTRIIGSCMYRDGEDENGLTPEELEEIGEYLAAHFDDLPANRIMDIQNDFIAYNKARGWRGVGGEDVRTDLVRYLRRWIGQDQPKKRS